MTRMQMISTFIAIFVVLFAKSYAEELSTMKVKNTDPIKEKLVAASNDFGVNLLKDLLKKDFNKNVFISPSSISICLSVVLNGANGKTFDEMQSTLGLTSLSLKDINNTYKGLLKEMTNPSTKIDLSIANSIWLKEGTNFKKDYLDIAQIYYNAHLDKFNKSPDPINDWIDKNTKGLIKNVIDDVSTSKSIIVNTIYFKGEWQTKFKKDMNETRDFTLLNGSKKKHEFMCSGEWNAEYYRGDTFQAINLPYGEGDLSMYIFLPDESSSLKDFYAGLTADRLNKYITSLTDRDVVLYLPKLNIDYGTSNLKPQLQDLGMKAAFTPLADFSKMSDYSLMIDTVIHKTRLEVNEDGTKAAAVTVVMVTDTCAPNREKPKPVIMVVDRPYFLIIRDNRSGLILFMGSIVEPSV